jgi:hypothetical protein
LLKTDGITNGHIYSKEITDSSSKSLKAPSIEQEVQSLFSNNLLNVVADIDHIFLVDLNVGSDVAVSYSSDIDVEKSSSQALSTHYVDGRDKTQKKLHKSVKPAKSLEENFLKKHTYPGSDKSLNNVLKQKGNINNQKGRQKKKPRR